MAIAHNASAIDFETSAAIVDVALTISGTPSDCVGVAAIGNRSATVKTFTSVTWDYGGAAAQAMTIVNTETIGNAAGAIAYIVDPTTKSGTITVRLVISANARVMCAPALYSGVSSVVESGASNSATTGSSISATATSVGSDDWVVGASVFEDGGSNQTTSDTQRQQDQTGNSGTNMEMMLLDDDGSGGGSVSLTVSGSVSGDEKTISMIELVAAGGGGGPTVPLLYMHRTTQGMS